MKLVAMKNAGGWRMRILTALALIALAVPASAQKKDKNKNAPTPAMDPAQELKASMRTPDGQAVDQAIGESLGYWQLGDTDSLHKYYAEDVVMVSGAWEPPVIGWDNFLKSYQAQRAQVTGMRMDRSNTLIKVNGDSAWATYQFIFAAQTDGKVVQFRGHTTLFLKKQSDHWVITLNHSSIVDSTAPQAMTPTDPAQPAGH